MFQDLEFVERFEHSQIESRTANSAAGKGEANSICHSVGDPRLAGRTRRLHRRVGADWFRLGLREPIAFFLE